MIFWDASGSRAGDHGREIALLLRAISNSGVLATDAIRPIQIDLVLLRNALSQAAADRYSQHRACGH